MPWSGPIKGLDVDTSTAPTSRGLRLQQDLQALLQPGETILWAEQPRPDVEFRRLRPLFAIGAVAVVIAAAVLWSWVPLFILAVPAGLWHVTSHTLYAATDRRVIVFRKWGWNKSVQSYELAMFEGDGLEVFETFAPSGDIVVSRKLKGPIRGLLNLGDVRHTQDILRGIARKHAGRAEADQIFL